MKKKTRQKIASYVTIGLMCVLGLFVLFLMFTLFGDFWNKWTAASREYHEDWLWFEDCRIDSQKNYNSHDKRAADLAQCKRKNEEKDVWPLTRATDAMFDDIRLWFGAFVFKSIYGVLGSWWALFVGMVALGLLLILFKPTLPWSSGQQSGSNDRIIFMPGMPHMGQMGQAYPGIPPYYDQPAIRNRRARKESHQYENGNTKETYVQIDPAEDSDDE